MINNNILDESLKKEIVMELKKIENYVESALYYARLGTAYKDYLIQKIVLGDVIKDAIHSNRVLLISNRFSVQFFCDEQVVVHSDRKWVLFMLNQVILNAVKYVRGEKPRISIEVMEKDTMIQLQIKDNGIGICTEDLPRVFDKGYTGKNGHDVANATGIGLYLVKKMCEKLEIEVSVDSIEKEYTSFLFQFKKKRYFFSNLSKL